MSTMICIALAVLLGGPLSGQEADPIDPQVALAAFDQAREIAAADNGDLWGVPLAFPILFIDPESRVCVANRDGKDDLLNEWRGVWRGQHPADKVIANATTQWAGRRWTMLVWPPPAECVARARLLMHESFHNAQCELGNSAGGAGPCTHLGTYNSRLWLRLEAQALVAALQADGVEREEAAADALLFRAVRRSLFAGAAEAEDGLERLEGSAEYTGAVLSMSDERERIASTVKLLQGLRERPSLTRSFMYATGSALGLLLDTYDPFWRETFLAGGTFGEMLAPAVWFELPAQKQQLKEKALGRAARYAYERIAAEEESRERQRQERLVQYRACFLDGPMLILTGRSPKRSFDPSRIEQLGDVGAVYGTLWLSDEWGVAEAPGGALILADNTVHLPAPSDVDGPELAGDGWTLKLNAGWTVVPGKRAGDYRVVASAK